MPSDDEPAKAGPGTMLTTPEIRTQHIVELKPEICTLDLNTQWFGGGAVINSPRSIKAMAERMYAAGSKPELEIWDIGQISNVKFMLDRNYVDRPIHIQFVMGALSGMPATPGTLVFVYEQARAVLGDFSWSVAAVGRDQMTMAAVTLAMGGQVRVGMEDSLWAGYGQLAKTSAEQVERVKMMAKALSIEPATPNEARQMLGLKGIDKVNY